MPSITFNSKKLCNETWLIDGDGCSSYLLVGNERGIVIDTGFAKDNIQEYAQSLTDKPVKIAANTHGHYDHTGGNGWFEQVFMSAEALKIAKIPYPSKVSLNLPTDYLVTVVGDGDIIELGDRTLEVIEIPAHAPSSIAFLDRKERILFSGDEVGTGVMLYWMQEEPQPTVEQHASNMRKLINYKDAFDFICSGHSPVMGNSSLVQDLLDHDQRIISGVEGQPMEMGPEGPEDFVMYQPEFKRESFFKDTFIGYDCRYITGKKDLLTG